MHYKVAILQDIIEPKSPMASALMTLNEIASKSFSFFGSSTKSTKDSFLDSVRERKLDKNEALIYLDEFVEEYLIDLNATQAAIRAGYSAKTADQQGSRMLANVKVQQAISVAMAERSKRTGINQDRVVLELARIAFVKMTDLVDSHGRIKDGASEDDLACIESVKYKQSESETGSSVEREVKISPKLKALELLGKHLGMWNDKLDVNITQPIVITGEDALED